MLIEIISNEELDVKSEEQVFKAVINWVRHDLENRQQELSKVNLKRNILLTLVAASIICD